MLAYSVRLWDYIIMEGTPSGPDPSDPNSEFIIPDLKQIREDGLEQESKIIDSVFEIVGTVEIGVPGYCQVLFASGELTLDVIQQLSGGCDDPEVRIFCTGLFGLINLTQLCEFLNQGLVEAGEIDHTIETILANEFTSPSETTQWVDALRKITDSLSSEYRKSKQEWDIIENKLKVEQAVVEQINESLDRLALKQEHIRQLLVSAHGEYDDWDQIVRKLMGLGIVQLLARMPIIDDDIVHIIKDKLSLEEAKRIIEATTDMGDES